VASFIAGAAPAIIIKTIAWPGQVQMTIYFDLAGNCGPTTSRKARCGQMRRSGAPQRRAEPRARTCNHR